MVSPTKILLWVVACACFHIAPAGAECYSRPGMGGWSALPGVEAKELGLKMPLNHRTTLAQLEHILVQAGAKKPVFVVDCNQNNYPVAIRGFDQEGLALEDGRLTRSLPAISLRHYLGANSLGLEGLELTTLKNERSKKNTVIITGVRGGSKAAEAGFKNNDVILNMGDKPVGEVWQINKVFRQGGVPNPVPFLVGRGAAEKVVHLPMPAITDFPYPQLDQHPDISPPFFNTKLPNQEWL